MAQFSINATRFDPYKNFKFRVKWDGRYVAGVSKVSALKRTTEVVEHREGGDPCVTEQEVEAAKADILKKRVTALEDSRNIHRMLIPQMKRNRTLLDREQRDLALAKISKADVDAVIQKYIKLDQLVEVMADQYGKAQPALKK